MGERQTDKLRTLDETLNGFPDRVTWLKCAGTCGEEYLILGSRGMCRPCHEKVHGTPAEQQKRVQTARDRLRAARAAADEKRYT